LCAPAPLLEELDLIAEPWVSVEDVAKHLGVAKDSVYRWIETKRLPAKRIGRLWKFKISEVDAWVQAGGAEIAPASDRDDVDNNEGRNA
jgi:excisionase family DNA binding protein